MREVEAYRRFKHPNIIRILVSMPKLSQISHPILTFLYRIPQLSKTQTAKARSFISFYHYIRWVLYVAFYLCLYLSQRGNIQDRINSNVVNGSHIPEQEMVRLFKGTCQAVQAMHEFIPSAAQAQKSKSKNRSNSHQQNGGSSRANGGAQQQERERAANGDEDEDEDHRFPEPEGDSEGGYSYGPAAGRRPSKPSRTGSSGADAVPLMDMEHRDDGHEGEVLFDGDEDVAGIGGDQEGQGERGEMVPYAHRDIKPGCVSVFHTKIHGLRQS